MRASESYAYNQIGNLTARDGLAYSYGSKPHAVSAIGTTAYSYDPNGNMVTRGSEAFTWNAENRLASAAGDSFVYDGDGARVKKTDANSTILYVNKYFEKNLTTGETRSYYYLGERLVGYRSSVEGLRWVYQDHLGSTSVVADSGGSEVGRIDYYPYGQVDEESGALPAQRFTGQRWDNPADLYYYNARYYDPEIARFISADPAVQDMSNSQALNRYSYVINNPGKYTDPSGLKWIYEDGPGVSRLLPATSA